MLKSWHKAGAQPAPTGIRTKAAARADEATDNRIGYSPPLSDQRRPSAEVQRPVGALARAGRMSRPFRMIDSIPPARNTWREYRRLVWGAVSFSPRLGVASNPPPLSAGR